MNVIRKLIPVLLYAFIPCLNAQVITIKGKVTDMETGEPLPFVHVFVKNSQIGTTTDFEGYYQLSASREPDSLTASYIGYLSKTKKVVEDSLHIIDFQLKTDSKLLDELVVYSGENPAFSILRNVMKHKKKYDRRNLEAYQYQSYNKTEIAINNISEKFSRKKTMQKIYQIIDTLDQIAGEDGKPVLPEI